jgi:hypothetical protein
VLPINERLKKFTGGIAFGQKSVPNPKPSLDKVMPRAQLEKKVRDYLRDSQALEDYWQRPISAEQLQAEMERMAQHTKQPEVLRELFEALGNDPFVIAECLARPALSERLVTNLYAHGQRFHGELRQRAEADLRTHHAIEQMKQKSGDYSEIELVRSDGIREETNSDTEPSLKLNSREWDEEVQRLVAMFGDGKNDGTRTGVLSRAVAEGAPITQIKIGVLSLVQEDEQRYYATAILKKAKDRLKLATVEWRKEPLASWRARAENHIPKVMSAARVNYTLPAISDGAQECIDDTWTTSNISGRYYHTAVWTGSEMIVWGGYDGLHYLSTGGRYNPSTDNWTATSTTNASSSRASHTAVWTGSEMIVWGGYNGSQLNTGGRYDPGTDNWIATTTNNAPDGRAQHTAVWSGSEMIVWGGDNSSGDLNTGGRYCAQSQAPMAQSAFSRKTHGAAGTFDIQLPLTGNVGVECRSGGATNDYQMIISFATSVTVGSASVTSGTGSVSSFSVSGSQVTVNLTGVTNVQRITVTLFNVSDGTHMGNVPVSMGVLVGDVNGNAVVNATDVALTKSQVGMAVSSSNFREDVNANGTISSTDVAIVKSDVGAALPP